MDSKGLSIRSSYIGKLGRLEKRFFSIFIIEDRAKQALCKLALEPEWEARFETNSYGFRPGRNCHDAVKVIFLALQNKSKEKCFHKYILDVDISKYWDRIDSDYLLNKLETFPEIKGYVKLWLKAGIIKKNLDEKEEINLLENIMGTSQGEIILPLLSNIVFHGLENHMKEWICGKLLFAKINNDNIKYKSKSFTFIRYVNNLVLIHKDENIIREAKKEIAKWFWDGPYLKLTEEKISIRNTNNSFNFLGFTFITISKNNISTIKIYPSRKSQALLLLEVRSVIQNNRSVSSYTLINFIYPIIIEWAHYYKYSECSLVFKKLSYLIVQKLRAWVFRRDTRNGRKVIKQRYFPNAQSYCFEGTRYYDNWILNGKQLSKHYIPKYNWLPHMVWVKREKWIKINGRKSPFDRDNLYWEKRIQIEGNYTLWQYKLIQL